MKIINLAELARRAGYTRSWMHKLFYNPNPSKRHKAEIVAHLEDAIKEIEDCIDTLKKEE